LGPSPPARNPRPAATTTAATTPFISRSMGYSAANSFDIPGVNGAHGITL
jgi:hypothetical protein